MAKRKKAQPGAPLLTSTSLDLIDAELRYAGSRAEINRVCKEILEYLKAGGFPKQYTQYVDIGRAPKKNFAQRFSSALAQKIADAFRDRGLEEILPNREGTGHETESRGGDAIYRIDVNYSTKQGGLGLAVSVKTVNFRDATSKRYTKNTRRADKELRAEADECHKRHPYAVLAAIVLLPIDAAFDKAERRSADEKSSLRHAWTIYRHRAGRTSTRGDESLFEYLFLGVYEDTTEAGFGAVKLFDVIETEPPVFGLPESTLTFAQVLDRIFALYKKRNP